MVEHRHNHNLECKRTLTMTGAPLNMFHIVTTVVPHTWNISLRLQVDLDIYIEYC
jgi:hypothetical protein